MTRFTKLTIAAAVAAALGAPTVLAQQSNSTRVQERDATGNPSGSPTQPPRPMASDRTISDPTMRWPHGQHSSSTVRDVQQALQDKGYDVGPIDGVMGARTQSALRQYQQQQGMTVSGRLDQQTLSGLNVQASGRDAMSSTGERSTMGNRSRGGTAADRTSPGNPGSGAVGAGSPSGSSSAGGTPRSGGDTTGGTMGGSTERPAGSSTGNPGSGAIGSGSPSGGSSAGGTTGGTPGRPGG